MPEGRHKQVTIQVWIDIDEEIAPVVAYLNTIPGVRTHASCQGTLGEGGPNPYRPQVMVTWDSDATFQRLRKEFDISILGSDDPPALAYVHPRQNQRP